LLVAGCWLLALHGLASHGPPATQEQQPRGEPTLNFVASCWLLVLHGLSSHGPQQPRNSNRAVNRR